MATKNKFPKGYANFLTYIKRIMHAVEKNTSISANALGNINSLLNCTCISIAEQTARLSNKATLGIAEVKGAVSMIIPAKISNQVLQDIDMYVNDIDKQSGGSLKSFKLSNSEGSSNSGGSPNSEESPKSKEPQKSEVPLKIKESPKTILIIPPSRTKQFLKGRNKRIGRLAIISLAATVESLCRYIFVAAMTKIRESSGSRINTRLLALTMKDDIDMERFVNKIGCSLITGGIVPIEIDISDENMSVRSRKAIKDIKKQQELADGIYFPREAFIRTTRHIIHENGHDDIRIGADALNALQLCTENYVLQLLEKSDRMARHANRSRVNAADVSLVAECCFDF